MTPSTRLTASLLLLAAPVRATWSILVLDTRTGEIVIASATCVDNSDLLNWTPVVIPGVGVAVCQAASPTDLKVLIHERMLLGHSPERIKTRIDKKYGTVGSFQYAILDMQGRSLLFTGGTNGAWAGGVTGQDGDLIYGNQGLDTVFGGQQADVMFGGQDDDLTYGNRQSDMIYGNRDEDTVYGGQDEDTVYGGQCEDTVWGNKGDDLLFGNRDDDVLYGGGGDDTMGGGQGTDIFVFETESGSDVISDFDTDAGEVLDLTRLGFDEDFAAFKAGRIDENADGDAVVDLGGDNKIVLLGVGVDDLQASHFTLV